MPSAETFSIPPIRELLRWRLRDCAVVIDPFARNNRFGTITNDLNPETAATFHLDALEFLNGLVAERVVADAILFDPPYSTTQVKEIYAGFGREMTPEERQFGPIVKQLKNALDDVLRPAGIAICCGWNSLGMGSERNYDLEEILLVPHGGVRNDTIVTVERKMQASFDFKENHR